MKFIFIYQIIHYLCEKLNVMQTDNHFEKLQHQHEAQQYFENEGEPPILNIVAADIDNDDYEDEYTDSY